MRRMRVAGVAINAYGPLILFRERSMNPKDLLASRLNRRAVLTGAAALGGMSLLSQPARAAEQWPARPVKLIVPFAAGGTTDILARVVAAKLSEEHGQQFIVENKAGASGNIGFEAAARSAPDGYTVLIAPDQLTSASNAATHRED